MTTPDHEAGGGPIAEDRLHARFRASGAELPASVLIGPGDDMGLVDHSGPLLVAADQVVLGRHVRPDEQGFAVGRKAVLRNLSDVAAMAATPVAMVATATLGPGQDERWATELHRGLHETGLRWKTPLVGGDLATHGVPEGPTVVSVTVLASPHQATGRVVTRDGGRPGDLLVVTGTLGGSLAEDGGGRHLDFPPRIREASALLDGLDRELRAMIDLSDGLARDASRLAAAGGLVARLDPAAIPTNPGCDWRRAIGDGEDYELLVAIGCPPPERVMDVPLTVVGRLEEPSPTLSPGAVVVGEGTDAPRVDHLGWEHRGDDASKADGGRRLG